MKDSDLQAAIDASRAIATAAIKNTPTPIAAIMVAALLILTVEDYQGEQETHRVLQEILRFERKARREKRNV